MDLFGLKDCFRNGVITACNIGHTGGDRGYQVSIKRPESDGWETYYGSELSDILERAVAGGPQLSEADDWRDLV